MNRKKVKLILGVKLTLFCLFCCLLPSNKAWAQECSQSKINSYIKKLNNTNEWILTIGALRKCGSPAVAALADNLQNRDEQVRIDAASALASMGIVAQPATHALATALKDTSPIVRSSAATALGSMGARAKIALPPLIVALQDSDKSVRSVVATALGSMGVEAQAAIPALTLVLQDKDKSVRSTAAYALGRIGADFQYQANSLSTSELEKIIWELEKADKVIKPTDSNIESRLLNQSLKLLKAERDERWLERTFLLMVQNKLLAIAAIYLLLLILFWSLILWLCPVWLLHINNVLKQHTRITLPGSGKFEIPVRYLILVKLFDHHPRVLDAWINTQIVSRQQTARRKEHLQNHFNIGHFNNGNAQFDQKTVQKYAKAIAWECVKRTYQPTTVKRTQALAAITTLNGRNAAEKYLQYLEVQLGIIQTIGKAKDEIRFTHDLLAEYLAGLYLVELCGNNEVSWRKFLAQIDTVPNKQAIIGFLLTVRDCSYALQASAKIPSFVPAEIAKRVGVVTKLSGQVQAVYSD